MYEENLHKFYGGVMEKGIILYTTKTGNTKKIADYIAEGIRFTGSQAEVKNISEITDIAVLKEYSLIVLGSPTYGGKMMDEMEEWLGKLAAVDLKGKCGGAFGSFGWSGEAPEDIYNMMKDGMQIKMAGDCLRLKAADIDGGMKMAQGYGKEIGAMLYSS